MEHKHGPRKKERHLTRRIIATGIASTALLSVTGNEISPHDHVAASERTYNSNGRLAAVDVDLVVLADSAVHAEPKDYSVALPEMPALLESGEWCKTPNVLVGAMPGEKELQAAADIEMGMGTEEYIATRIELETAPSKEAAWTIFSSAFKDRGVNVLLNAHTSDFLPSDTSKPKPVQNELRVFGSQLSKHLNVLTQLPEAAVSLPSEIDFVEITGGLYDKSDTKREHAASGLYYSGSKRIVVAMEGDALLHEYGHAINHDACTTGDAEQIDGEMRAVFNRAKSIIANDELLRKPAKYARPIMVLGSNGQVMNQLVTGFPTDYAKSAPGELVAEMVEATLRGNVIKQGKTNMIMPYAIQQLTAERIGAATGVDIGAYLDAKHYYGTYYQDLSLKILRDAKVSPYGSSFKNYPQLVEDKQMNGSASGVLKPAVEVRTPGRSSEYIYSLEYDGKTGGKGASLGEYYGIQLAGSGDTDFDQQLVEKSFDYLTRLIREKQLKAYVDVRHFSYGGAMLTVTKFGQIDTHVFKGGDPGSAR